MRLASVGSRSDVDPISFSISMPVNMLLVESTGTVLVRCCQHRPSTGPILALNGMFMGMLDYHS